MNFFSVIQCRNIFYIEGFFLQVNIALIISFEIFFPCKYPTHLDLVGKRWLLNLPIVSASISKWSKQGCVDWVLCSQCFPSCARSKLCLPMVLARKWMERTRLDFELFLMISHKSLSITPLAHLIILNISKITKSWRGFCKKR